MAERSLEELLLETEQRILNNDFYKKYIVTYEDEEYGFYVKPISQNSFIKLSIKYANNIAKLNEELVYKCLVYNDGTPYKKELIEILLDEMPAGFSTDITKCIYEVSGIETDKESQEMLERFLEGAS